MTRSKRSVGRARLVEQITAWESRVYQLLADADAATDTRVRELKVARADELARSLRDLIALLV